MIKKVVSKPSTLVIKKFPEFDTDKIYATSFNGDYLYTIYRDDKDGKTFKLNPLSHSTSNAKSYNSFEEVLHPAGSCKRVTYILDNQDQLARFIMGCREFPKVEAIEYTVGQDLAEDEITVEDCNTRGLYATLEEDRVRLLSGGFTGICSKADDYTLVSLKTSNSGSGYRLSTHNLYEALEKVNSLYFVKALYQFDTQEEFLRWALEHTTGKKFAIPNDGGLFSGNMEIFV